MLIFHRITPFLLVLTLGLGACALVLRVASPVAIAFAMVFFTTVFLGRLLEWEVRQASFWMFLLGPLLFLASAIFALFFLESIIVSWIVVVLVVSVLGFFSEQLFQYLHTPSTYQPYALEHFSLNITVLTVFFLSASLLGLRVFLQIPLLLLFFVLFFCLFFLFMQTFWLSKIEGATLRWYAFSCALLVTEVCAAITLLPIGFWIGAALVMVVAYMLVGLVRARWLKKLSHTVIRRYVIVGSLLLLFILLTARWV